MVYSLGPEPDVLEKVDDNVPNQSSAQSERVSSRHSSLNGSKSSASGKDSEPFTSRTGSTAIALDRNPDDDGLESWIELPHPDAEDIQEMVENIESARQSLQMIDSSTQSGASLDVRTSEMEKHLVCLQEDNTRLIGVLQENNNAMKRNLKTVHVLRSELSSLREAYSDLRESSADQMKELRDENNQLKQRISSMEEAERQKNLNESIHYFPLDMNHETTVQEMSSKLVEKDMAIQRLNSQMDTLRRRLDQTSEGMARMSLNDDNNQRSYGDHSSVMPSTVSNMESKSTAGPSFLSQSEMGAGGDLLREIQELKAMVNTLREEKGSLERLLTANSNGDNGQSTVGYSEEYEESGGHGRRRRHHRHHRHAKFEKKMRFPTELLLQGITQASQAVTNSVRNFANQATTPYQPSDTNKPI
ncbi:uncharacterized protein LOC141853626 [Brevipalpus obovatus]|uniref:uncharacterized protein LOC141853626 n=1 Tax=Brevipalpus obovatus TaxID=246614 RepID=UPI003D9E65E0